MDGMTVGWAADSADVGQVAYGRTESYGKTAAISICDRIEQKPNARAERFACRARLRGLTPGMTYHYEVSGNGIEGRRTGRFRIPRRDDPLLVVFQSDASPVTNLDVAFVEKKVGRPIDLLVDAGDTIQHGRDFFDFKPALYRRIPIVLAQGNHEPDWTQKDINFYYLDYEGGTPDRRERAIDYGPARWILGPYVQYADDFTQEQLTWIENQLKNSDRAWKFYVCHHVFFSDGYHNALRWGTDLGEGVRRCRSAWPLFTKHNVRAVVHGHDHVYQRTFPIDKDGNVTPTGTVNLDVATGNSVRTRKSPWMARFIRSEADKKAPTTGVTYLYLEGDRGRFEFHTRPLRDAKPEDFKLADRFTFSPTRFNDDAMKAERKVLMEQGLQSASSPCRFSVGKPETVISHERMKEVDIRGVDGGIYALNDKGTWKWFCTNLVKIMSTIGPREDPFETIVAKSELAELPDAYTDTRFGFAVDHRWGDGPTLANVYLDRDSGHILAFIHTEWTLKTKGGVYFRFGLAISRDGGKTFQWCGHILTTHLSYKTWEEHWVRGKSVGPDAYPNVGLANYVVRDGYFYLYYTDTVDSPDTFVQGVAVARAKVDEVMAAAESLKTTPWKKYYQGKWNEPGIEGRFTPLNIEPRGFLHGDAAYNSYLDAFVLVARYGKQPDGAKSNQGQVLIAFSRDGINWSEWRVVHSDERLHDYPSIVSTGDDNEVLGKCFWIYYKYCFNDVLPEWDWYTNRWERVLVTID